MANYKQLDNQSFGFTIVELMIATTVFSIVLLVALAGFLQIGRLFYKGTTISQTQNVTQQILDRVASDVRVATNVSAPITSGNGYEYYCIGNQRYTRILGNRVDLSAAPNYKSKSDGGNFGLLRDTLPGSSPCAAPCISTETSGSYNCTSAGDFAIDNNNPQEMLSNNMRLHQLNVYRQDFSANPKLYTITVVVASGDDSTLEYSNPADLTTGRCVGGLINEQHCAVHTLTTSVYKGLNT